jgi:hypothetical protein
MHELHDDSSFADARSHALDRAVAHIANHENTRHVDFEQTGISIEGPRRRPLSVSEQVRPGENESALVALDEIAQPLRARLRADENEQAAGGQLLFFASVDLVGRGII